MDLQLWLDAGSLRHWHGELVESLVRRRNTVVSVRLLDVERERSRRDVEALFTLERLLHRVPRGRSARTTASMLREYVRPGSEPDLVIDLAGAAAPSTTPTWRLSYNGGHGEEAAIASLVAGRFPVVTIDDAHTGEQLAGGTPGSESPGVTVVCFDDLLARCTTLLHAALDGAGPRTAPVESTNPLDTLTILRSGLRATASAAIHSAYRGVYRAPYWRVGWRFVDGPDVIDLGDHPSTGWNEIPDDGFHFYADPFPIVVDGETYLFVEDFDHRVGRGVISVLPFDDHGPVGVPHPVLTHDGHLSYPFVLEADGELWMIPETSAANRVEIYRATSFPDKWVREAVLLDDLQASDVTVFRHADRWWMSGTVRDGGSYSDALHLWFSDHLLGPWTSHPGNPVVVDIATARPAGRVVTRDSRLVRPAQDCGTGYGAALALLEVDRLDTSAFSQRPLAHITPGPVWPGRRVHTLNRAGRLECIDGSRLSPRLGHGPRSRGDTP